VRRLREAESAAGFDLETRLKVVDALCSRSQRFRKEDEPKFTPVPAARFAEAVYREVEVEVRRVVEAGQ
jgi:hypothetical protein